MPHDVAVIIAHSVHERGLAQAILYVDVDSSRAKKDIDERDVLVLGGMDEEAGLLRNLGQYRLGLGLAFLFLAGRILARFLHLFCFLVFKGLTRKRNESA